MPINIGFLLVINNGLTICYGHLLLPQSFAPHAGIGWHNVTLPYTYPTLLQCFCTTRNNAEFAVGVEQTNNSVIRLGAVNHSDNWQGMYGMYWMTVGF